MAAVVGSAKSVRETGGLRHSQQFSWAALTTTNDVGSAHQWVGGSDRSVQITGTMGGATIILEGSNEITPTVWAQLHDVLGADVSFTAAGIKQIIEMPLWIRPRLSVAGGGTANINVYLAERRN